MPVRLAQGFALQLNGTNQYAERDQQIVAGYPFTLACWFRATSILTSVLVYLGDKETHDIMYGLWVGNDGTVSAFRRNIALRLATGSLAFNDGGLHMAVGRFISNISCTISVDNGADTGSNVNNVTYNPAVDRYSVGRGGDLTPGGYLAGALDEARAWNMNLSPADEAALWTGGAGRYENDVQPANLVLGLHFDAGGGNLALDFSGNAWHATLFNNPIWAPSLVPPVKSVIPCGL